MATRDNGQVSDVSSPPAPPDQPEVAQRQLPRRGRLWVILVLLLGLIALSYGLVNIATQKPNKNTVHIEGIGTAQELERHLRQRRVQPFQHVASLFHAHAGFEHLTRERETATAVVAVGDHQFFELVHYPLCRGSIDRLEPGDLGGDLLDLAFAHGRKHRS